MRERRAPGGGSGGCDLLAKTALFPSGRLGDSVLPISFLCSYALPLPPNFPIEVVGEDDKASLSCSKTNFEKEEEGGDDDEVGVAWGVEARFASR